MALTILILIIMAIVVVATDPAKRFSFKIRLTRSTKIPSHPEYSTPTDKYAEDLGHIERLRYKYPQIVELIWVPIPITITTLIIVMIS